MKGVMRFVKKGKLSPCFVGPFEITNHVGKLAYLFALPLDLASMHDFFHVSMLMKYIPNQYLVIEYESLEIQEGLAYEEMNVRIMDHKEQVLRTKRIPIARVLRHNIGVEEATWEAEKDMRTHYPHLFEGA